MSVARTTAPDISVIVCTRNRAAQLERMLESACALEIPAELNWELIVVDNNEPSDTVRKTDTVRVIDGFAGRLPIRRVTEARAGLCHARNRGVEAARGALICWTDDDVRVDRFWLAAYADAFARHPDAAVFGGRILPRLDPPEPGWFERNLQCWPLDSVAAARDFGGNELPLDWREQRLPWGANFAVRAIEQKDHRYSPELEGSGDETDLIYRIMKSGRAGWWVPASKVVHLIPPERRSWAHILAFYKSRGREVGFLHRAFPGDNIHAAHGGPRWAGQGMPALLLLAAAAWLISRAARAVGLDRVALRFWARHGYVRGLLEDRRR